jgi:hypothetical protein
MNYEQKYLKYKNKYLRLKQFGGFPSESLKKNISIIGIENIINLILVHEDVRPAMLLQPQDRGEVTGADPKTKKILDTMKIEFPHLIYSENYEMYQGIIISKINYDEQYISLNKMGEILGYPCYKDFEDLDRSQITYTISISATLANGQKNQILVNVCKDGVSKLFEEICSKANSVFSKEEYTSLFGHITFDLQINENIPPHKIIDKLINSEIITPADTQEISNIIYNFGFKMEVSKEIIENIQYTNSIHKGILISLLINHINDILSPFYPLQFYPEQQASAYERIESWGNQVIDTIMKTKI